MRYIFVITLLFLTYSVLSQNEQDVTMVENRLNIHYQMHNWDDLISISKSAIKNGTDSYIIRYLTGIAYYKKNNYREAANYFEKALIFNTSDKAALEYLYYSYLFSGRKTDAAAIDYKLPAAGNQQPVIIKPITLKSIYEEAGYCLSNNIDKNGNYNLLSNNAVYGQTDLNNNSTYGHLGLQEQIGKYVSIYEGYSNVMLFNQREVTVLGLTNGKPDDTLSKLNEKYTYYQNEFYINSNIYLGKGLTLTPAFHLINVLYPFLYAHEETRNFLAHPSDILNSVENYYRFEIKDTAYYNFVGSLSLTKEFTYFSLNPFVTYSNLNALKQLEGGVTCNVYPFGNLNLYTSTTLVNLNQNKKNNIIINQLVGGKISPKLWLEGFVTYGNQLNYNELNAFVVNNISDKIDYKWGISLILPLSAKINLSLRYQFIEKESSYVNYTLADNLNTYINKYNNQNFICGFQYQF